jgi:hypothetical protein
LDVEEFIDAVIGGTPPKLFFMLQKRGAWGNVVKVKFLASPKGLHQAFELPAL